MKRFLIICMTVVMSLGWAMAQPRPHNKHHGHDRGPGHRTEYYCATPEQMSIVMRVLQNQSFDDKKLEICELAVVLGAFCVDDLARMAEVFTFDDNRLKFLQTAYPYCSDPENYYYLRRCFTFESNFDKLMEACHPRRK